MADIRVGDLIKATRKDDPEVTVTSRVRQVAGTFTQIRFQCLYRDHWDIAVIDRPRPAISDELLLGGTAAYREGSGYYGETTEHHVRTFGPAITAVINYLREHDTYNKEITK